MSDLEPGIYFGLPEDDYFAIPALSASGVKNIRMSPMDFWARAKWLNPGYDDDNEETEESFAKTLGKAYHKRILEGRDAFLRCYVPPFNPADHKGALDGSDEIKDALRRFKEQGAAVKLSVNKPELIAQLREIDPSVRLMDDLRADYTERHAGKVFLEQKSLDKIELSAAMIERDPQLAKAFAGGMPEVTIVWDCHTHGIRCKARLDYLKSKAIVDLKTVANKSGYPFERCIEREFSYNRYPLS